MHPELDQNEKPDVSKFVESRWGNIPPTLARYVVVEVSPNGSVEHHECHNVATAKAVKARIEEIPGRRARIFDTALQSYVTDHPVWGGGK